MDQPELGNNEEENMQNSSSAELSDTETAAELETASTNVDATNTEDTTEVDEAPADSSAVTEDAGTGEDDSTQPDNAATADDEDTDEGEDNTSDEADNGLRRGQVILGTVARTTPNEIFVNLGDGLEGIVPKREVEMMTGKTLQNLQEGAEVHVYVVNPRNHRGNILLSINHAQEELDWRTAEEYMEEKRVYDGKIGGYNKGGLIVRFGRLRGFVPQSQISDKRMLDVDGETPEERFSDLVNNQISVKVMEVDRSRNRLILSERAAMREVRQRRKEALITELEVGEIREGRVVSLENFGAFVDVGGAEGLVHITELSWKHVTHPRQVLNVGQTVQVRVISVDPSKNRIGLSIKQLQPDPWDELATRFGTGALIRATVTKLTKFGAFARVKKLDSVEGLIHISELSDDRVEHPREVVQKGDTLTLRVVKIDVRERRLGLSLRRVNSAEFLDDDLRRAYRDEAERDEEPQVAIEEEDADMPVGELDDADIPTAGDDAPDYDDDDEADAEEPVAEVEEVEPTEADEPEAEVESGDTEASEPEAEVEGEPADDDEATLETDDSEAENGEESESDDD